MEKNNTKTPARSLYLYFVISIVLVTTIGFVLHVYFFYYTQGLIASLMQGVDVLKPPYGSAINVVAFLTAFIPTAAKVGLYYLIGKHLWFSSKLGKGFVYGLLLSLLRGELIREPVMNYLIGNPIEVIFIQQGQVILTNITLGVLISLVMPYKR